MARRRPCPRISAWPTTPSSRCPYRASLQPRRPPAASPRQFLVEPARSLGAPSHGSPTTTDLVARVSEATAAARTGLVPIDEVHRLRTTGRAGTAVSDVLDHLRDQTPATFTLAGIGSPTSLAPALTCRRLLPIHPDVLPDGDDRREVIAGTERAPRLRAHEPGTLTAQADHLHQRTAGNVGRPAVLPIPPAPLRSIGACARSRSPAQQSSRDYGPPA
jgi:hypothetical protein